ncbi:RNA polymerase sigma-70 factor [Prolixibacteraceae bacterium Z1-6]|uniref:RNA polymerase sigma-70 factor n=1 Tax=Draconibacterium aestuarii TaxID=2998507 RepID=A0A9X3F9C1_9BACT|nr:RNA polymerase sigma-70 factor [Prolixibacteraceae bacterium Z1-6]
MNETFLKQGLQEKNKVVFDFVFQYYYSALCAYAESIIQDENAVEDIVQELFVTIWMKSEKLAITGSLKNYLFISVKNRCFDFLKHQKVRLKSSRYFKDAPNSTQTTPENWLAETELREQIENCLQKLPPRCQEIFRLSRFDGLKNQEIADQLGLSKRTVELQITNALKALRKDLQPYLPLFMLALLQ